MITTKKYNEFKFDTYITQVKIDRLVEMCEDFINNGGDLNLPILHDEKTYNFVDFVSKKMGLGMSAIKLLEEKNILKEKKIFWDAETSSIVFKDSYPLTWFLQQENQAEILKEVKSLIKEIPTSIYDIKEIVHSSHQQFSKMKPKIVSLLIKFNDPDTWKLALNHFKDLSVFIKDDMEKRLGDYLELGYSYNPNGNKIKSVLFDFDLISSNILNKNPNLASNLIINALLTNNIQQLEKLSQVRGMKIKDLESYANSENFFSYAESAEAAQFLLNNNCNTKNKNTYFIYYGKFSNETIKVLLDNDKERNIFLENIIDSKSLDQVLDKSNNFLELLVILKEKINLDFKKYYLMDYISHKNRDNYEEAKNQIDFLISNGIEVTLSHAFTKDIVAAREDGLKKLRNYKKLGILDINSPEFINAFLNNDFQNTFNPMTKAFYLYMDKNFTKEDFNKKLSDNKPVWWDVNTQEIFKYVLKNIDDKQLLVSSDKHSCFLNYFISKTNEHFNKQTEDCINLYLEKIEKNNLIEELSKQLKVIDYEGNNFLHHYLNFSNSNKYGRQLSHKKFSQFAEILGDDLGFLMMQTNNEGKTPIELALNKDDNSVSVNVLINWMKENNLSKKLNYFAKTKDNTPIYISIAEKLNSIGNDDLAKEILREGSYVELQKRLNKNNEKEDSNKIKI